MGTVPWSDLPNELLSVIAEHLTTRIERLRFRAVCRSWRSSAPPFNNYHPFSLQHPFPIAPDDALNPNRVGFFALTESTVYRIGPPQENQSCSIGWLFRLKEAKSGANRLLVPLSTLPVEPLPETFPKVLNLLDFPIAEVAKAYNLHYIDLSDSLFNLGELACIIVDKVVLLSRTGTDDYRVLVIYGRGKLGFLKLGDEKWTTIHDPRQSHYDDIISYKGQFHAVDHDGRLVLIDSSLKVMEIASSIASGGGHHKHLVECFGDLLLVDRYLDYEPIYCGVAEGNCMYSPGLDIVILFKVYKLNEREKRWVKMESLGDLVLFVGDDFSFSVSARDFAGCKGNCIYFSEKYFTKYYGDDHLFRGISGHDTGVFKLEDGSLGMLDSYPDYSQIFWPPPTWLKPSPCSSGC